MIGKYGREYIFAKNNPEVPCCKVLLDLAQLYVKHVDVPTLALIQEAAHEIRNYLQQEGIML